MSEKDFEQKRQSLQMEPEIERFVFNLVSRLKSEGIFASIEEKINGSKENWDIIARSMVGEIAKKVFQQSFPEEDASKAVYVEGRGNPIELFLGGFESRKSPYPLFGCLGIFPDIAILRPKRIMIELDNSGSPRQGRGGSRFKMALAKAAFGYMTGEWEYCFVFFHNRGGQSIEPYLEGNKEKRILEKYFVDFHTKPFLF